MSSFSSLCRTKRRVTVALVLMAVGGLCVAFMFPRLAKTGAFAGQYQIDGTAVSPVVFTVLRVSERRSITMQISSKNVLDKEQNSASKVRVDLGTKTEATQYQPPESEHDDQRLMFRIALGLGLAYVGFLACWIWATRLRSRPPRD